jgi:hypothetical protein
MSRARIKEMLDLPLVTIVRLMGAMRRRLDPKSAAPGGDVSPECDAAMIAELERRIKEKHGSVPKV